MPQPTTRYKRYLLYRKRNLRRIRLIEQRKIRRDHGGVQVTTMFDTSGLQYQPPIDPNSLKPRDPDWQDNLHSKEYLIEPAQGVPPVVADNWPTSAGHSPANHFRAARVHFQNRRVGKIPKLRTLNKFHPLPPPAPGDRSTYPLRYPSGQRNARAWMTDTGTYLDVMPDGWIGWNGPSVYVGFMYATGTPNNVHPFYRDTFWPSDEWAFWPYTGG